MGILNITPDSFSDGGHAASEGVILSRAEQMVEEGADLLDIGAESTRPGARAVGADEELARLLPSLRLIRSRLNLPLSIDTRKADVARVALDEGADIINDVSALTDPAMGEVVSAAGAGLVLMHMQGTPETMQVNPTYSDVVKEVADYLEGAAAIAQAAGVTPDRIVIDPGIGFGKGFEHNLSLMGGLAAFRASGFPILLGVSRKGFLGTLTGGRPPLERTTATAAACIMGYLNGARIFRVHDVREVRDALSVAEAILNSTRPVPRRC